MEKVIEDGGKRVLSSATTAVFNVRTKRLFIGGKGYLLRAFVLNMWSIYKANKTQVLRRLL